MASTIWKYKLEIVGEQSIEMPAGAQVLSANVQDGILCVWALVDPGTAERDAIPFRVFGTGNPVPPVDGWRFLGTLFDPDGLVWHVWVGTPIRALPADDEV